MAQYAASSEPTLLALCTFSAVSEELPYLFGYKNEFSPQITKSVLGNFAIIRVLPS